MCGYVDRMTGEDVAVVAIAEFWQIIYPNLDYIPTDRKAAIYEFAKATTIKEVKRCFPRVTNQKPLD